MRASTVGKQTDSEVQHLCYKLAELIDFALTQKQTYISYKVVHPSRTSPLKASGYFPCLQGIRGLRHFVLG